MTGSPPIRSVRGSALFVAGDDIDTDQIMPSRFLRSTSFAGLEQHVFENLRQAGPHPFDDPLHDGAAILIAERNFGCGSSREHAPQGLARWGIQAIIAESFGEIFAANCAAIGLVCVTLERSDRRHLSRMCVASPRQIFCVDVARQQVETAGAAFSCVLPEGRRRQFLDGTWDSLSLLLADPAAVDDVDARARVFAPPPGSA